MLTRRYRPLRPPSGRIDARWGTITYVRVVDGVVDEFARFATPREGAGPFDTRIEASANHPGNSNHIRCPYLAVANHLRDILFAPNGIQRCEYRTLRALTHRFAVSVKTRHWPEEELPSTHAMPKRWHPAQPPGVARWRSQSQLLIGSSNWKKLASEPVLRSGGPIRCSHDA